MQDRVAHHLDLTGPAVTGVDPQALVVGVERRASVGRFGERESRRHAVGPDVGLDPRQERVRGVVDRVVVVDHAFGAGEHELHLAPVVAPGGEQAVVGEPPCLVVGASMHPGLSSSTCDALPQLGRWVEQKQVHVAVGGERAEDLKPSRRQTGETEEREAPGQLSARRLFAQYRAGSLQSFRRARPGEPIAQAPPELGLPGGIRRERTRRPVRVLTGGPGEQHLGAIERVPVEQLGEVPNAAEATRLA